MTLRNGVLTIGQVSEADKGDYDCEASNELGSIRRTLSVDLTGTTKLPNVDLFTALTEIKAPEDSLSFLHFCQLFRVNPNTSVTILLLPCSHDLEFPV